MESEKYHLDPDRYGELVSAIYAENPPLTLTPEYAEFIRKNTLQFLIRLARYKFAARQVRDTDRVLEVGSGSGLGAQFLAQHAAHVTGIEIKEVEIDEAVAMQRRENVSFICGDFFEHKPDIPYDVIVSLDVIEHMDEETGRRLVQRMGEVLQPNGMIIVGSPSIYSYPHQSAISQASHVKCYDLPELVDTIEASFGRTLTFSMNDETIHTGYHKLAWYYLVVGFAPLGNVDKSNDADR